MRGAAARVARGVHRVVVDTQFGKVRDDVLDARVHRHGHRLTEREDRLDVLDREEPVLGHVLPVQVHLVLLREEGHHEALEVQLELRRREVGSHDHVRPHGLYPRARPLAILAPPQELAAVPLVGQEVLAYGPPRRLFKRHHDVEAFARVFEQEPPIRDVDASGHDVEVAGRERE
eukprot:scaffold22775_cov253-Isochrysis_galbana.AAC.2